MTSQTAQQDKRCPWVHQPRQASKHRNNAQPRTIPQTAVKAVSTYRGEGETRNARNLEWRHLVRRKFGTVLKISLQHLVQLPDCGTTRSIKCERWLLLPLRISLVAVISLGLLGTMVLCMSQELKMTPRKMASGPQMIYRGIIWHTSVVPHSIAYRQGTSKREGAQSSSHEIIQKPSSPVQRPK